MVSAVILVQYEAGKAPDVVAEVKRQKGVQLAFVSLGRWDIVADVEIADTRALGELAVKINGIRGVRASETLVGI